MNKYEKIAVLYGGESAEREVSLASGEAIHEALLALNMHAKLIDSRDKSALLNLKNSGFDYAFIALHGRGGEDGQIQALLEFLNIPYSGSGISACAIGMDKFLSKALWRAANLPVKDELIITQNTTFAELKEKLGGNRFAIKPTSEGSSVGVSMIDKEEALANAYLFAGGNNEVVMAEPWITGREISYPIVNGEVFAGVEINPSENHQFYDYEAKYLAEDTRYSCPANIPPELEQKCRYIALKAFKALGAKAWGRVDFIIDEALQPWILEINLVPGMTNHSLVPLAAKQAGYSFPELIKKIITAKV